MEVVIPSSVKLSLPPFCEDGVTVDASVREFRRKFRQTESDREFRPGMGCAFVTKKSKCGKCFEGESEKRLPFDP